MWNSHTPPYIQPPWPEGYGRHKSNKTKSNCPESIQVTDSCVPEWPEDIRFILTFISMYVQLKKQISDWKKFRSHLEQHNTDIPLRQQILLLLRLPWTDGHHANAIKEYITFQNMQTKFNFKSFRKRTYLTLKLWAINIFTYMLGVCVNQIKLGKM